MKTQRNFFIAMTVILFSCFSVYANNTIGEGKLIVKIEQKGFDAIKVQLANLHNQRTELKITDTDGKLWFKEIIMKEIGYANKFNLSIMPEGNYIIHVNNKTDKRFKAFVKNENGIALFQNEEEYGNRQNAGRLVSGSTPSHNPLIAKIRKTRDQKITLQLANLLGEEATVQLNKLQGSCQIKDHVKNEIGYAERFNFEGMTRGDYYFLIQHGNTVIIRFLALDDDEIQLTGFQRLDIGLEPAKLTSK